MKMSLRSQALHWGSVRLLRRRRWSHFFGIRFRRCPAGVAHRALPTEPCPPGLAHWALDILLCHMRPDDPQNEGRFFMADQYDSLIRTGAVRQIQKGTSWEYAKECPELYVSLPVHAKCFTKKRLSPVTGKKPLLLFILFAEHPQCSTLLKGTQSHRNHRPGFPLYSKKHVLSLLY